MGGTRSRTFARGSALQDGRVLAHSRRRPLVDKPPVAPDFARTRGWKDAGYSFGACGSTALRVYARAMPSARRVDRAHAVILLLLPSLAVAGCFSPGDRAKLIQEAEGLRRENERYARAVADRDATIVGLQKQVENLKAFQRDRPADVFAPESMEIVRRSGGADYDGQPGDDGVTVYLRLLDVDGDTVKVGGRIRIELLDMSTPGAPRVIGLYVFDRAEELRKLWYGRFGTQHFTLRCPFPAGFRPPTDGRVTIRAEFDDYLTGRNLSAVSEVTIATGSR